MTATTGTELRELLRELEQYPTDLDLINSLAIGYYENYDLKTDKEDFDYFEKAYILKKTVKSTHNFAWFLYFEWSEIEWYWQQNNATERALEIQNECLQLKPKSFYPYYQYGFMLMEQRKYVEALPFLDKAYRIEAKRDIIHNIGFCHFQLDQFQEARDCFSISASELDTEMLSLYNLAITDWKLKNVDQVKCIADSLFNTIVHNSTRDISGYDIGLLFYLMEDFTKASECVIKQRINGLDLLDWDELSYSLFITNSKLWADQIIESIEEREQWLRKIIENHEDWSEVSNTEKKERRKEIEIEIKIRKETLSKEVNKPELDLKESVRLEHCGCLLFDCRRHENKKND